MAKAPTLTTISAGFASQDQLNANFSAIATSFENTVSRDGSAPNTLSANLDLNSNDIVNANAVDVQSLTVAGTAVTSTTLDAIAVINADIAAAEAAKTAAEAAQTAAVAAQGLAQEWASNPDGVSVTGTGGAGFSALHYSLAASGYADDALAAAGTYSFASATEPSPTFPYQLWLDTSLVTPVHMKLRNTGDTDWHLIWSLNPATDQFTFYGAFGADAGTVSNVGFLQVFNNATITGTLGVTGATTTSSLTNTGNATVGGTFGVTGLTTLGDVTVSGDFSAPWRFTSAEQTITTGTTLTVAHGLGAIPKNVSVILRCKTASTPYAVGEEVIAPSAGDTASGYQVTVSYDATNVYIRTGTNGIFLHSAAGVVALITTGNFRYVVRAD